MKFEKISQEDREKLERRLYKTIVEEFRREKIKDGYYKYIVSLQGFKFITDITDNELKESIPTINTCPTMTRKIPLIWKSI